MKRKLKEKNPKEIMKDERASRKRREWYLGTPKSRK